MKGYQLLMIVVAERPPPVQPELALVLLLLSTEEELLVAPCTQMTVYVLDDSWLPAPIYSSDVVS